MLKFNGNGKFRIMQISDIQDTQFTSKNTIEFIAAALDREKPDLVVFSGDQVKGYGTFMLLGSSDKNTESPSRLPLCGLKPFLAQNAQKQNPATDSSMTASTAPYSARRPSNAV